MTRTVGDALGSSLGPGPVIDVVASGTLPPRELPAFAAAGGRRLRQADIEAALELPASNEALFEYRNSLVGVITRLVHYARGDGPFADVLTAYRYHTHAIATLPVEWHALLVEAECSPETVLGQRWWEGLKQAAQAAE